jgi:hypothetical protein
MPLGAQGGQDLGIDHFPICRIRARRDEQGVRPVGEAEQCRLVAVGYIAPRAPVVVGDLRLECFNPARDAQPYITESDDPDLEPGHAAHGRWAADISLPPAFRHEGMEGPQLPHRGEQHRNGHVGDT